MKLKMTEARKSFTLREKADVLKEALRLLRKPENWVTGDWKCELVTDGEFVVARKDDLALRPGRSSFEPYVDKQGRQQYAYCVEGAINQAMINVLGKERARSIGQVTESGMTSGAPAELVSVNELLRSMADPEEELITFEGAQTYDLHRPAQGVNDSLSSYTKKSREHGHAVVTKLLRKRLNQLRYQIKKEQS